MKEPDTIKEIMQKFKFSRPLPPEAEKEMLKSKKDILVSILKRSSRYSFFVALTISLFFWIKRIGLTLSIAKTSIIVGTAVATTVSAVTAGTVYTVKKVIIDKPETIQELQEIEKPSEKTKPEKTLIEKKSSLKELYEKYHHIERIHLFDGRVFTGALLKENGQSKLITPEGTIIINEKNIKKLDYVNKDEL